MEVQGGNKPVAMEITWSYTAKILVEFIKKNIFGSLGFGLTHGGPRHNLK